MLSEDSAKQSHKEQRDQGQSTSSPGKPITEGDMIEEKRTKNLNAYFSLSLSPRLLQGRFLKV